MKNILILLFSFFSINTTIFAQIEDLTITIEEDSSLEKSPPFYVVEDMPNFKYKNCHSSHECFMKYVSENIVIPADDCSGKIYFQFVVEPDSTISNFSIIRGIEGCSGYEEEVKRIIDSMPKWTPGKEKGKTVPVMMLKSLELSTY